jgi:hypothetical protein
MELRHRPGLIFLHRAPSQELKTRRRREVRSHRLAQWVAIAALSCSCGEASNPALPWPMPASNLRVLFIGNSLTESNDLPNLVVTLARAAGTTIATRAETMDGYALEDHWALDHIRAAIAAGEWDWVVLQQGPSSLPESRVNLIHWTRQFDTLIRAAGARTALYMVWPESTRQGAFPAVSASYRAAATAVGGAILPAGDAWQAAWNLDPTLPLYGSDGFHPAIAGSYLAALTVFGGLTGRSPLEVPLRPAGLEGTLRGLQDEQLHALREAAAAVVEPASP